jgi:hypothetical protein
MGLKHSWKSFQVALKNCLHAVIELGLYSHHGASTYLAGRILSKHVDGISRYLRRSRPVPSSYGRFRQTLSDTLIEEESSLRSACMCLVEYRMTCSNY